FILPVAIWGWRLLTHRPLKRERIRLLFWIFGVLLSAGCAAALPRSAAWPLPVGLGGVIGDWMLRLAALFSGGAVTGATRISVAIAAGAGPRDCFAFATGFGSRPRAPRRPSGGYVLPSLELLAAPKAIGRAMLSADTLQANATALEGVLADFGVRGEIINARPGPVVTLYELEPAPGIKSSRVIGLADDIARSMSALSARVAVVAGRNVIGIELPNPTREKVYLREQLASRDYIDSSAKLPLCLGKTIGGEPV